MKTKISLHFTLEELIESGEARIYGYAEQFTPPQLVIDNLTQLAVNVLDAVRDLVNKALNTTETPLNSTSGYRCARLNTKVGGEPNSQHLTGCAADIICASLSVDDLYQKIKASNIAFDELIIEHDKEGHRWVHISWNSAPGAIQRGVCMKGSLRPTGGTDCVADGYGAFKQAA